MHDSKMAPAPGQISSTGLGRKPYEPPTVSVIPLKIEERLLACGKVDTPCANPPTITKNKS